MLLWGNFMHAKNLVPNRIKFCELPRALVTIMAPFFEGSPTTSRNELLHWFLKTIDNKS